MHVVVVGAGFAGSILARVARSQGHDVTLVDKGTHPRFALGESSTPLAAISLERLAARYGLDDLHHLAAYGRWRDQRPELRCGLKRGFTFYRHHHGERFRYDPDNANRLLVAASPNDEVADTHWFREDVDHHLVRRAEAEGVRYLDGTDLQEMKPHAEGFRLTGVRGDTQLNLQADLVVDASGAAGVVARHLNVASAMPHAALCTGLIYGHFEGVRPLRAVAARQAAFSEGPYPDEWAAVHHLIDEGWMYELRFDHDVVSAGFVIEKGAGAPPLGERAPADAFQDLLGRYPTLADQFDGAQPTRPLETIPLLQRRVARAAGERWALLPHAYMFWSPLFSTGIAWSLVAVERLGVILERVGSAADRLNPCLQQYAETLSTEGDHLRRLAEAAYGCRLDFDAFDAVSQVYFAAASYCEAIQRLCAPAAGTEGEWAWFGFLGATDRVLCSIVSRATTIVQDSRRPLEAVRRLIAPRNVAGLADRARRRLYPVDLEALVAASRAIGLSAGEARARLSRLRAH